MILAIYGYLINWNMGSKLMFHGYFLLLEKYFDKIDIDALCDASYNLGQINLKTENLLERFEKIALENKNLTPVQAIKLSWYFAVKGNLNQPLWNSLIGIISKLDSLTDVPKHLLINLYEILFMIRLEAQYIKFGNLERFFEDLDEIWTKANLPDDKTFKNIIHQIIDDQCFILERGVKASLFICDYGFDEKDIVLVCGSESFVGNTKRDVGRMALKKRLLKAMGYKIRVIDKMSFALKKKFHEKIDYIKKELKGIPIDKDKWVKKQKEKGIFY